MHQHTLPGMPAAAAASHLAEVVSVKDPGELSRVQVRLLSYDGVGDQDGPVWARVAVPFAGKGRGSFLLPDVGDEVLVVFIDGDPRQPVVVGGLWNGKAKAPEKLGGDGKQVDRWTITGKAGTRVALVEERQGEATVSLTTPGKVSVTLTQAGGGKIELSAAGTTVTIDSKGFSVTTGGKVSMDATEVYLHAGPVTIDSAMVECSQAVQCESLFTNTALALTYTPGAGNIL